MRIVVTGSQGSLGSELCRRLGPRAVGLSHADLDITDRLAVSARLAELRPDVVINTAAYTAVDRAESEVAACQLLNCDAVSLLAEACTQIGALLVQISTDYVFGADLAHLEPYRETDTPGPQSVYARSKLEGENRATDCPRHLIVRTCGLYGRRAAGSRSGNFVDTMLRLARERDVVRVVDDQHCTPSSVAGVAAGIEFLIRSGAEGIYHVVDQGSTTWHDFAGEIFRLAGARVRVEAITTAQYAAAATRPAYSVLDTSKYRGLGGPQMPDWHEALARYLAEAGCRPAQ